MKKKVGLNGFLVSVVFAAVCLGCRVEVVNPQDSNANNTQPSTYPIMRPVPTLTPLGPRPYDVKPYEPPSDRGNSSGSNTVDNCNPASCKGYDGPGGPCYDGPGGPLYDGPGGQCYDGPGGPRYAGPGGPLYNGPGGPCYAGPGGPCYNGPGGTGSGCKAECR